MHALLPDEELTPSIPRQPRHAVPAPVEELEGLVETLVDQLAAGQVETLYDLHAAAGDVRRATKALSAVDVQLTEVLESLAESVAAKTADKIAAAVEKRLAAGLARIDKAAEKASRALESQVEQSVGKLAAGTAAILQASDGLDVASLQMEESAVAVHDSLEASSQQTLDAVEKIGFLLVNAFAQQTETFFTDLAEHRTAQVTQAEAWEDHLVTTVNHLSDAMANETAKLHARDVEQETLRADALVAALEVVMDRAGGRRALRDRVRDALIAERQKQPEPAPVVPVEPARPVLKPVVTKAAAPKKAPAKKAPAKKAPAKPAAKKAPAKKTTASSRTTPLKGEAGSTPTRKRTVRIVEEI